MNRNQLVQEARSYLRQLSRNRSSGTVTADDIHSFLTREDMYLKPNRRQSLIRSVLSDARLRPMDFVASRRPVARYRKITEYRFSA